MNSSISLWGFFRHALLRREGSGEIEGLLRPNPWRERDQARESLLQQAG